MFIGALRLCPLCEVTARKFTLCFFLIKKELPFNTHTANFAVAFPAPFSGFGSVFRNSRTFGIFLRRRSAAGLRHAGKTTVYGDLIESYSSFLNCFVTGHIRIICKQ
ncbi:MAG: hypothetical protein [Circular genetic element sp.]|nr:MAG: hypothetical protein [Circular genetic element sp.]